MTDEGEDENEVATKKRKVSKATPKKTPPKKVSKEKKSPRKPRRKRRSSPLKGTSKLLRRLARMSR